MGDEHDVLEVLQAPFRCFFIEDELRGRQRPGHLHQPADAIDPCSLNPAHEAKFSIRLKRLPVREWVGGYKENAEQGRVLTYCAQG